MGAKTFALGKMRKGSHIITLFDQENGSLAAIFDASLITAIRTAATSALAADLMLRDREALSIGILGSGALANYHLQALMAVRKIDKVKFYSPNARNCDALVRRTSAELGIDSVSASSAKEAVSNVDLVVTAARSQAGGPYFDGDWLRESTSVLSIGSTLANQRDVDGKVIDRSEFIICDDLHNVLDDTGDMINAEKDGILYRNKSYSLADFVKGQVDQSGTAGDLRLYKSCGSGLQDVAIAETIFRASIASDFASDIAGRFVITDYASRL